VWLDRGELDKIIDRSLTQAPPAPVAAPAPAYEQRGYDQERGYEQQRGQSHQQPYRKKKKESWLSELFD